MSDSHPVVPPPILAFYVRFQGYYFKQVFTIIQSLATQVDMHVDSTGINIAFPDRYKNSGHKIFIERSKIIAEGGSNSFVLHKDSNGVELPLTIAFDPTIFHRILKRINKSDNLEMGYWYNTEHKLVVKIRDEDAHSFVPLLTSNSTMYSCSVGEHPPNVVINSRNFSGICTSCHNEKCSTLKIIGCAASASFIGMNSDKIALYEHTVWNRQTYDARETYPLIVEASLPSHVFRSLNKFSTISSNGDLSLYFSPTQVIIVSNIGSYGSYLITIPRMTNDSEKIANR